jgi:hypothetical protein
MAHTGLEGQPEIGTIESSLELFARSVFEKWGIDLKISKKPGHETELKTGKSLKLYTLRFSDINHGGDLAQLVIYTARWHHQMKAYGYYGYARTYAPEGNNKGIITEKTKNLPEPKKHELLQFTVSTMAKRIDLALSAFTWQPNTSPLVHLLVVPEFHVYALWLFYPSNHAPHSEVVVIKSPPHLGLAQGPPWQRISSNGLLVKLQTAGPMKGIC